ncbi:trehalose-phosphatase [Loktanella sp. R86503]|uniref:trehalose-phosphatase n=1 Tax=Loktanella sp. R86503 TaxID=3093847 RepID=UPI0036D9D436
MTDDSDAIRREGTGGIYLMLDFDGTLVDLAPTPDGIHIPDRLHGLLAGLHDKLGGRLCLVSGREVAVLEQFLPDFPGDIFGAHGAEARLGGTLSRHPLVGSPTVAQVQDSARNAVAQIPGATLETKDTGAVIHYRAVPEAAATARAAAQAIAAAATGMEMHTSKMAFEIRPSDASKAGAVHTIVTEHPGTIRPVVIGDDVTDEEAMVVANAAGGFAVRVGDGDTCAAYRLPDPAAVLALLETWLTEETL